MNVKQFEDSDVWGKMREEIEAHLEQAKNHLLTLALEENNHSDAAFRALMVKWASRVKVFQEVLSMPQQLHDAETRNSKTNS